MIECEHCGTEYNSQLAADECCSTTWEKGRE